MQMPAADPPCACTALRKATRAVSRVYDEAMAGTGMTIAQFAVLRNIARSGAIPLSRLADMLVMDRTSLYRALTPLERQGWVEIAGAASGRTRIVSLTATGQAAMEAAIGPWRTVQTRLIDTLGDDRWAALQTLLGGVVTAAADLPA